jgi:hypothetical protein
MSSNNKAPDGRAMSVPRPLSESEIPRRQPYRPRADQNGYIESPKDPDPNEPRITGIPKRVQIIVSDGLELVEGQERAQPMTRTDW